MMIMTLGEFILEPPSFLLAFGEDNYSGFVVKSRFHVSTLAVFIKE